MDTAYIYGLCDPISQQLRYVGKTINIERRLREHLLNKRRNHLTCWLWSLVKQDRQPEIFIIEETDKNEWQEAEQFWISYFKFIGADLVNGSRGGLGGSNKGHQFSIEGRARINAATSAACKGKSLSAEHREKLRLAKLGRKQSLEHIIKRITGQAEFYKHNPRKSMSGETKRKISDSKCGKPGTPHTKETIERISAAQRGRPKSEETKKRMSEAQKRRFHNQNILGD